MLQKIATEHIPVQEEPEIYLVKAGDTLWSIAENLYSDPKAWIILYIDNEALLERNDGLLQRANLVLKFPHGGALAEIFCV